MLPLLAWFSDLVKGDSDQYPDDLIEYLAGATNYR